MLLILPNGEVKFSSPLHLVENKVKMMFHSSNDDAYFNRKSLPKRSTKLFERNVNKISVVSITRIYSEQFKSATQSDLWKYLTDVGHTEGVLWKNLTISQIMDTWILQKGYPVVSAFRLKDGNLAAAQHKYYLEMDEEKLTNERNRLQGTEQPSWWIPLSITTKQHPNMSDTSPKFWMFSSTHLFYMEPPIKPNEWFILNMQRTGYFRVNYDNDNWLLIIQQLIENHKVFDDITRAQIIDDSFALAYSEELDYEIPLTIISYLRREESPYVISTVLENIQPLLEVYSHDALFGEIKDFLVTLLANHYPKNGLRELGAETHFEKETAIKLVQTICKFYEPCIEEAKEIFAIFRKNQTNFSNVHEDLYDTILCTVVSEGGEKEWQMLWSIFTVNNHQDIQHHY
ncbi:Aminopeptidase N [Armadillidium vulgare]|nr:Aminopeptidase N [Armadillidium vulgare]